ncbi:MAG: hypothetical protein SP1CHLAM54_10510 [Chlamydiia bacterium]|nr:hypothetical protein [Chlamydiia bacterium]MCH9615956.1 hypothetical protein [Chlamydiia bacterium]MCH9628641.1 hypothetical protein [Chlamydiia bacterium]
MENVFEELIEHQEARLLKLARTIIPHLTADDIMQPFDFPELEGDPVFRYEEGYLHGIRAARTAVLASQKSVLT